MRTQLRRHGCWAVLLILAACSLLAYGQDADMQVTRTFSTAYAVPGSTFQVALRVKANADLQGVGIREELPLRWIIQPVENAGAAFKRSEAEWVFSETLESGDSFTIVYEVTVPEAGELLSDPLPQCFSIRGTYQATIPSFETAIEGESEIEIASHLPIGTAIAHLIPESPDSPDTIDLRLSRLIQQEQLERALELWQADLSVPGTGGERLDLATVNHVAAQYETCTPADELLPLSIDPELQAVRIVETNLPCDSVLLPEGCLDPGLSARVVTVTVQITPSYDAYGVGLREWFPPAWRIRPIQHNGFWYRASASEWIYPTRVVAGQTIELTYEVEVIGTAIDLLDAAGCCGQEMLIQGEVSSALECSVAPVTGERIVTVQHCLPVILAISRWDTSNDRLDAELSNFITFPQVQRAIAFWQMSSPVPHTCGYTVGYHALKEIVAYWLAGLPITRALPTSALPDSCEASPAGCEENECTAGWLCGRTELQDPEDFVGLPDPPNVFVDGGPDCQLTCARPSATLVATTQGGVEPFQFEWIGPSGQSLSDGRELVVTTPGEYTVVATSCGGCIAIDTVNVAGDFEAPQLSPNVSGVLTGDVTSVDLAVSITGGTEPFLIQWMGPTGAIEGTSSSISVSAPGIYQVHVTGGNGCSAVASVAVEQNIPPIVVEVEVLPSPPITLSVEGGDAVLTCEIPEIRLCSTVSGGRQPYHFVWTDGESATVGDDETLVVTAPDEYALTVTGAAGNRASVHVNVLQNIEPPVLSTSVSDTLTCQVTEVSIAVEASAGQPPYAYVWTDSAGGVRGDTPEITIQDPGVYAVTVTGANGCSASATATVSQDVETPLLSTSVSGELTCAVREVSVAVEATGGRPPYTYGWTDPAGNDAGTMPTITVQEPGTYAVTVTGANGCSTSSTVEVNQDIDPPVVTASASDVLTCGVLEASLTATVSGGRAPFDYAWTNAAGHAVGCTPSIDVSAPGAYTVIVTGANGCSARAEVTVGQDTEAPVVEATVDGVLSCALPQVNLHVNIVGGRAPLEIEWRDASDALVGTTALLPISTAGRYTVTVTGANGCWDTAGVTVLEDRKPPAVSIEASGDLTCVTTRVELTSAVTGGRPPYVYVWLGPHGEAVGNSSSLTVSEPGTYLLTVTGANGCETTATIVVLEDIASPVVTLSASGPLTCASTEVTLTSEVTAGRAPYEYAWLNGDGLVIGTDDSLAVGVPGTYVLTVIGANGCVGSAAIVVAQDIAPPVVTTEVSGLLTCDSTEAVLTADADGGRPPYVYAWFDSEGVLIASDESVSVDTPGKYSVTVTGANGCKATSVVDVFQDLEPPTVTATACGALTCSVTEVCVTSTVSGGRTPYRYVWTDLWGTVVSTASSITVSSPGEYTLTVTGANGCSNCATVTVVEDIDPPVVSLGEPRVLTCAKPAILIEAAVCGGRAPFAYQWTDHCAEVLATTKDLLVDFPGTYTLTVTGANGCVASGSVDVLDGVTPPIVDAGPDRTLSCAGDEVLLDATVAGGLPPYGYAWVDACGQVVGTCEDLVVSAPGVYILTATTSDGCVGMDSVTVASP